MRYNPPIMIVVAYLFLAFMLSFIPEAQGANQYWDTSSDAGIQGGDGVWSVATPGEAWSAASTGTALSVWTGGNDAWFVTPSNGAASTITLSESVSAGALKMSGSPYILIITNNGALASTLASTIGNCYPTNFVTVAGSGANWSSTGSGKITVGSNACLIVGNGGTLYLTYGLTVSIADSIPYGFVVTDGGQAICNYGGDGVSTIIGGNDSRIVVDGSGSVLSNRLYGTSSGFQIGGSGSRNMLLVTNGGVVRVWTDPAGLGSGSCVLGYNIGNNSNAILVAGSGSLWTNNRSIYIGNVGSYNSVTIANSGLICSASVYVGYNAGGSNNSVTVSGSGSVWRVIYEATQANRFVIGNGSKCRWNQLVITNGGLVTCCSAFVGVNASANSNSVIVTGAGSHWDLGGGGITNGIGSSTDNVITITQDATVDNVSALAISTNNYLYLLGGTLAVKNTTHSNELFVVGDGSQRATLVSLAGGTLAFQNGLLIASNAQLIGYGTVNGAAVGVAITNGAAISPAENGPGTLTISGSNLTWCGGGVYTCEVTDVNLLPGVGYDVINVSTQLVLAPGGSNCIIRVSSRGSPVANFQPDMNYTLKIMGYGDLAGTLADIYLDTNSLLCPGATTNWALANTNNGFYLIYHGLPADTYPPSSYAWQVPSNGYWSAVENWQGPPASAPLMGGSNGYVLSFTDDGTDYTSTNDLTNGTSKAFMVNQMQFTSASTVTNILKGGPLVFATNADVLPRIDYLDGLEGGFTISNLITFSNNTTIGGDAFGGILKLGGTITNLGVLSVRGKYRVALATNINNNFIGPLVVNCGAGGEVRAENANSLGGGGPIIVSNGILSVLPSLVFANSQTGRQGLVTGSGSLWTNIGGFTLASGANSLSNTFTVASGALFHCVGSFFVGNNSGGDNFNNFIITNGGRAAMMLGNNAVIGSQGKSNTLIVTGVGSTCYVSSAFYIGYQAGAIGNSLRVENGAILSAGNVDLTCGGSPGAQSYNTLVVSGGGKIFSMATTAPMLTDGNTPQAYSNSMILTGSGTLVLCNGGFWVGGLYAKIHVGNTLLIDDNAVVSNTSATAFYVGGTSSGTSSGNGMTITNGGKLFLTAAANAIGYGNTCSGNTAVVAGSDSLWNLGGGSLTIGQVNGTCNALTLMNGGTATNVGTLTVANGAGSLNNSLVVDGGNLYAASLVCGSDLANSFILTGSGSVTVTNQLAVSNTSFSINFGGGTLNVRNSWISNAVPFIVGDGSQSAVLNLLLGGTNVFVDGLDITNGAMLCGAGSIAATTTVFGTLNPGDLGTGIGVLTNMGDLVLNAVSTSKFDIAAATEPGVGWDHLYVADGMLTLGGTLRVQLSGGYTPSNTDSYLIMTNTEALSGFFTNAADGQTLWAYTNAQDNSAVGTFRVNIGAQSVILNNFLLFSAIPGTVWIFH